MNKNILQVVVGSRAHGLDTPESDYDYRGVYVAPTDEILKLGGQVKNTNWVEGGKTEEKTDDTSWELSHFLHLATHCNPTILEVFLAPVRSFTEEGDRMRGLFPYLWNSKGVKDAFKGYGFNQQKKMLDNKEKRDHKYACAYLRTLYNAWELLTTGTFTIRAADTPIGDTLKKWKFERRFTHGEVIDLCREWGAKVDEAFEKNPNKETDLEKVNEFLLDVRYSNSSR